MTVSLVNHSWRSYPIDVLEAIAIAVFESALPCSSPSLDPLYSFTSLKDTPAPTATPSSYPPASWSEPTARTTLATLCLVCKDFRHVARPLLWRRLEVNIPRNWLGILDAVCGEDEVAENSPTSIAAILSLPSPTEELSSAAVVKAVSQPMDIDESSSSQASSSTATDLPTGDGSVPLDLLTPPCSRDPSPARLRLRATSPGRWRFIKAVNKIIHHSEPGLYVPTPDDPSPGRHVRHLDFNHFRTIGLRRSVGDGIHARFVTEKRLERLLKEMPNLRAFGATEFMDSAISAGVLAELILRGSPVPFDPRSQKSTRRGRGRGSGDDDDEDVDGDEFDEAERRASAKPLEALDFCGCVSTVFVAALNTFVRSEGLLVSASNNETAPLSPPPSPLSGPSFSFPNRTFKGLRRLGLRGVVSVPSNVLAALVLSFPNLTHLDLSGTLCTPALLEGITSNAKNAAPGEGMKLKSLALGRCVRLTSTAISRFIIGPLYDSMFTPNDENGVFGLESPVSPTSPNSLAEYVGVCGELEELSLYGDKQFPTPLTEEDLLRIVTTAPCFTAGASKLTYLDLSSCPVTTRVLDAAFASSSSSPSTSSPASKNKDDATAPSLRSLGLSCIPTLRLAPLISLLITRAPNVEVLSLVGSCTDELSLAAFSGTGRVGEVALALTVRSKLLDPLCSLPFRIQGLRRASEGEKVEETPTRLRALEFSPAVLNLLPPTTAVVTPSFPGATCSPAWTTVRSRGGRAWYVDAGACWINGKFVRGTNPQGAKEVRPVLEEIQRVASFGPGAAGGHGTVGWHAHKMEILHGLGLLGREDGLYGAVSYAYTTG